MNWGTAALRLCSIFPASWKREFTCSSSLKFSLLFSSFPFPSLLFLSLSPSLSLCFLVLLYDGVTFWAHAFHCGLLLSSAFWVNSMLCLLMLFPSQSWSSDIQFSSFTQSCLTFCYPMDCSTPGFPVLHQLPEIAQTHVHRVGDAIQPSHSLSSPSPPAFYLSQHQGLFQWVSSLHQVAKVLEFQLQHLSFQWMFRTDLL